MTDRPAIDTKQMRSLHALLRDHGITGDKAVHEYINSALEELGMDPVASRKDLTRDAASRLIEDLKTEPIAKSEATTPAGLDALRKPFPAEAIGKLPRGTCRACRESQRKRCDQHQWVSRCPECNGSHSSATMHIDYVGHADVTARLLEVDPLWTWEPMATDPTGLPVLDRSGGLWIYLTVLGVTRPGYGDSENGRGMKEALGDALRNAAMRFGVALDLWAKGDREWAHSPKTGTDQHPDQAAPGEQIPPTWSGPSTTELLAQIDADAARAGVTYGDAMKKFIDSRGITLNDVEQMEPRELAPLAAAVKARADQIEAEREKTKTTEQTTEPVDPWATPRTTD